MSNTPLFDPKAKALEISQKGFAPDRLRRAMEHAFATCLAQSEQAAFKLLEMLKEERRQRSAGFASFQEDRRVFAEERKRLLEENAWLREANSNLEGHVSHMSEQLRVLQEREARAVIIYEMDERSIRLAPSGAYPPLSPRVMPLDDDCHCHL